MVERPPGGRGGSGEEQVEGDGLNAEANVLHDGGNLVRSLVVGPRAKSGCWRKESVKSKW